MSTLGNIEQAAVAIVPGGPWVRLALKAAPYFAIAALLIALLLTRGTLDRVKAEHKAEIAGIQRQSAQADAAAARKSETAANAYAARVTALQPLIVRSKDTVTTYAQTDAGRAPCLGAERLHGIDELDAALFTPPAPTGAAGAVRADPRAPAAGRGIDQRR